MAGRYDRGAGGVGEDVVAGTAHRVDKPKLRAARQYPLSQHRHQRHNSRSASEKQNPGLLGPGAKRTSRQWIREARVLTETVARQRSGIISADKLPPECRSVTRRKLTQMEALERDAIVRSLQDNGGNKQEAARALRMSRATIYRKINDYGIA